MPRRPSRRGAVALAIVASLASVVFLGVSAASYFRRSVTRRLDALVQSGRLVDLAEAAISEVAHPRRLGELYGQPEVQAALEQAFTAGAGRLILRPDVVVSAEASETRARLTAEPGVEVSPVTLRLVEYVPLRNVGRLRLTVEVAVTTAVRRYARTLGMDYQVSFYESGGELKVRVPLEPLARLYP